jgi:hypothetical protein
MVLFSLLFFFGGYYMKTVRKDNNLKTFGVENPQQDEEIKKKGRPTVIERFGVENPQQNINHLEVENPQQNEEIKKKRILTDFEKYIVESCRELT